MVAAAPIRTGPQAVSAPPATTATAATTTFKDVRNADIPSLPCSRRRLRRSPANLACERRMRASYVNFECIAWAPLPSHGPVTRATACSRLRRGGGFEQERLHQVGAPPQQILV